MNLIWTKHLKTPEDVDAFKQKLKNAEPVLDILRHQCRVAKEEAIKVRRGDYKSSDWYAEQCHRNGIIEMADRLLALLDHTEEK